MSGFLFRLETVEGEPADPPTLSAAVPNWRPGEHDPHGAKDASGGWPSRRRGRSTSGVDSGRDVKRERARVAPCRLLTHSRKLFRSF
jgi:hypothetical protein